MPPSLGSSLSATFRRLADAPDGLSDAELLARFASGRDAEAFAALVRRHGALVFGACLGVLRDHADAEDAFQATFLALAARPGRVNPPAAVAGWLYGAACRLALNARRAKARRNHHEAHAPVRPATAPADVALAEARAAVHEEVGRLPERYRAAVVLFYLTGRTQDEVARDLGLTKDGVKKRLARARGRLETALGRRGIGPAAVAAALTVSGVEPPAARAEAVIMSVASPGGVPPAVSTGVWPMSAKVFLGASSAAVVAAAVGLGWLWGGPPEKAPVAGPAPAAAEVIPVPPREVAAGRTDLFGDPLPAGAVLRLGTVKFRVPDAAGVGFRKTGELVAVSEDLQLYVWPADGTPTPAVTPLTADARYGWRRALSADARFAAAVLDKSVVVWDVSGAKPVEYLTRPGGSIAALAFSPDGSRLAVNDSNGGSGQLFICDLAAKTWATVPSAKQYTEGLSFTPDGRWLAVTTRGDVSVIDTATAKERCRVVVPKVNLAHAALSPDGGTLAVLTLGWRLGPPAQVRFFAVPSGAELTELKPPAGPAQWVEFAPDGKTLFTGGPHGVREWDFAAGRLVRETPGPGTHPPAFSPDGRRLAAHSRAAVMLVDRATGTHVHPGSAEGGHAETVLGVTVSPDGKRIATNALDGEIRVWAADTGRPLFRVASTWGNDPRLAFLPDGTQFIAVAADYVTPVVRDAATGKEVRRFAVPAEAAKTETIRSVELSADGSTLTTVADPVRAERKSAVVRWDVKTGRVIDRAERAGNSFDDVLSKPAVSPDGQWRVAGGKATRAGGAEAVEIVLAAEARGSAAPQFSPDGRWVAVPRVLARAASSAEHDVGDVVVFDLTAKARVADLPSGRALRLAVSPDGRRLAVIGREDIAVWDVTTAQPVRRFRAAHGSSLRPRAIAFTPDGRRLVTGMNDCTALVWDVTGTGRPSPAGAPPLSATALAALWATLGGSDAVAADTAAWELADRPGPAVALIRDRLAPAAAADAARLRPLMAKLLSDEFAVREAAEKELRGLGDPAVPAIRAALAGSPPADQRDRLEWLAKATAAPAPADADTLRAVRAVAVLEVAGTPEAKAVLRRLAGGLDGARLTREATAALVRLGAK